MRLSFQKLCKERARKILNNEIRYLQQETKILHGNV